MQGLQVVGRVAWREQEGPIGKLRKPRWILGNLGKAAAGSRRQQEGSGALLEAAVTGPVRASCQALTAVTFIDFLSLTLLYVH